MASKDYWDTMFKDSTNTFLLRWYIKYHADGIKKVFEDNRNTIGKECKSWRMEEIGTFFFDQGDVFNTIYNHFSNSEDSIVNEMFACMNERHRTKALMELSIKTVLCVGLGRYIKNTEWWEKDMTLIKKQISSHNKIRKVLNS